MSKISEFATKQNEYNDKIDNHIFGLTGDIQSLKDEIQKLKDSLGDVISDEDKALLTGLETRSQIISAKLEALDALTPPAIPTDPTVVNP